MTLSGLVPAGAPSPLAGITAAAPAAGLRVTGLDLSITSTGVCRPDGSTFRIKTRAKDGPRRLQHIRDVLACEIAAQGPILAAVEDLPTKMHASSLKIIGALHGVVQLALLDAGVPWVYIAPATLKAYACDNGRADKPELAAAAHLAAGVEFVDDKGGDQCDAWWLRAATHEHYGQPLFELPQAQRDRLTKVSWPELHGGRHGA
ncbi:crossover junction endodeoxyribonuclease RuvC [Streptomyces sp. NPDC056517]|uniref:crossover junction endodeoxyribonuclease RuvC n=1 Tax=Streptomyces sp. NPDC056517 TaxID=3345848 RepID=UPI0036B808B6